MKIPVINDIKTNIKKLYSVTKHSNAMNIKPIKNYDQYMKEYGLK